METSKNFEVSKDNIITADMEDLSEEDRQRYFVLEAHIKSEFLKGFRKNRGNTLTRVQEFVMPSIKMSDNKIEVIPNVSAPISQPLPTSTIGQNSVSIDYQAMVADYDM